MSGIHIFDSVVDDGNVWLKAIGEQMKTNNAHVAYGALRATLHTLRDRIPMESAVHLGAQLPTLIRGIYYENWRLAGTPTKERHSEQFLDHVARALPTGGDINPEIAARAVFDVITDMIDHREIAKVIRMLPVELRDLWPLLAQIDAAEK